MNDNEQLTVIFQELSKLNQFAKVDDDRLVNMLNGCEIKRIEEHVGNGTAAFNSPTKGAVKMSWGDRTYSLTVAEAQRYLNLMKN